MGDHKKTTNFETEPKHFSHSRIPLQSGTHTALLHLLGELKPLMSSHKLSPLVIEQNTVQVCNQLTGATWGELLLENSGELQVLGKLQGVSTLRIDESSLPGKVALQQESQIINNANSSNVYANFSSRLHAYSRLTKQRLQTSSVACVPIKDEGQLRAVVLLFNKVDENKLQSFFTENDLLAVQAVGLLLVSALDRYEHTCRLRSKLRSLNEQSQEGSRLRELQMRSIARTELFIKCKGLLASYKVLTADLVRLIGDVMDADAILFHCMVSDSLVPLIESGTTYSSSADLCTKTAQYVAFRTREILNIEDLFADPLWGAQKKIFYGKALLSCPIVGTEDEVIGVLEFFRNDRVFTKTDYHFALELLEHLKSITAERCLPTVHSANTSIPPQNLEATETVRAEVTGVYAFSLEEAQQFEYVPILSEVERCLKRLLRADTCNVYIVGQQDRLVWTQRSLDCDPLVYPLSKGTFFAATVEKDEILEFPGTQIADAATFAGKFSCCVPVRGNIVVSGVIGLLVLSRGGSAFSALEKATIKSFTLHVGELLQNWFIHSIASREVAQLSRFESVLGAQVDEKFRSANQYYKRHSMKKLSTHVTADDPPLVLSEDQLQASLNPLCQLACVTQDRMFELKRLLGDVQREAGDCLKLVAQRLAVVVPCQKAALLLVDSADQWVVDVLSSGVTRISGLIAQCLLKREVVLVRAEAAQNPYFDRYTDGLELDSAIESFLAVPICSFFDSVLGLLVFVNAPAAFTQEDVALAQFLALLPREYILTKDDGMRNLQSVLRTGRRHKMLQHWCKQVFVVANSTQNNMVLSQGILQKLFEHDGNLEVLLQASLEIVCAATNSESASLVCKEGNELEETLLNRGALLKVPVRQDDSHLFRALDLAQPLSISELGRAQLIVPFIESSERAFVLKALNKRDDTLTYSCSFTKADELLLTDFVKAIARASCAQSLEPLTALIRQQASSMNTFILISTIRTAAQKLLDCDRATVFIREGKAMTLKAQGLENEMPGDFSVPVGKGIIGNVAQTGQIENLKDVYEDPRFNVEVDRQTGYKTSTMLCMPVLDRHGKVIAALQMINKRYGTFDRADEETLEIFCEIISTVLSNWDTFQRSTEEKNRFLNILNSLGNYILVISDEGALVYSNKQIDELFGVEDKAARKSHYSTWLRGNRQLVYDITSIQQRTHKKIHRTAQKIMVLPIRRNLTTQPTFKSIAGLSQKEMTFNYTVASLQDYFDLDKFGVVLILEDATTIEELNLRFAKMQEEIDAIKTPLKIETSLQKCIAKLQLIAETSQTELNDQLRDIINTLKQGNLHQIEVTFGTDLSSLSEQLREALVEYIELDHTARPVPGQQLTPKSSKLSSFTEILPDVREINLDVFSIENYFPYITSMLTDFDLFNQFEIPLDNFAHFVGEIKENYELWGNPYHNFVHGFNVMHMTYLILTCTSADELYAAHDILALLIAGLCHDVQHTGRTNAFETNRKSSLAILYNDTSVLENHHAALTFKILQNERTNIFCNISADLMKAIRKLVITAILATDMLVHFRIINEINSRLNDVTNSPLGSRTEDSKDFAKLLMHAADLGHPCLSLGIYQQWSARICEEFTNQFQEEVALKFPPTELMKDLHKPAVYYDKEHGFLKFVVLPLWNCMSLWLQPHVSQFTEQLHENIAAFVELKEKYQE